MEEPVPPSWTRLLLTHRGHTRSQQPVTQTSLRALVCSSTACVTVWSGLLVPLPGDPDWFWAAWPDLRHSAIGIPCVPTPTAHKNRVHVRRGFPLAGLARPHCRHPTAVSCRWPHETPRPNADGKNVSILTPQGNGTRSWPWCF